MKPGDLVSFNGSMVMPGDGMTLMLWGKPGFISVRESIENSTMRVTQMRENQVALVVAMLDIECTFYVMLLVGDRFGWLEHLWVKEVE